MRFDLSHLVLAAACATLGWLLFTDGCCGDVEVIPGDTSSHVVSIPTDSLVPDTVYIPTYHDLIRTVFRKDTAAIIRLAAAYDSIIAGLQDSASSRSLAALDSLRLHVCDSLALVRDYTHSAGDSNVTVTVFARTFGVLDSLSIGWRHHREPVMLPGRGRVVLVGFTAASDTAFGPSFQYHDRRGRSFQAGYDLIGRGVTVGAHFPVFSR